MKLAEALDQQAATSEVFGVISGSPGELASVFQAMLENATRICGAKFGILFRYEGGVFHPAAMTNVPPPFTDFLDRQGSFAPVRGRLFGRLLRQKKLFTSLTGRLSQRRALRSGMVARDPQSACHCSRVMSWSAPFSSIARGTTVHGQAGGIGTELRRAGRHRN
jgi:hypothetical protein